MNRRARQLLVCVALVTLGCTAEAPRARLTSPSGERLMDAWYGIYVLPLEGPGGTTEVNLLVAFVDGGWRCQGATTGDAGSFVFEERTAGAISSTVLSRSGPILGPTTGGNGQVTLSAVDDRYQGEGATGPLVGSGGRVDGKAQFDFGDGVSLSGDFDAPHCAALDFRNAP